MGLLDGQLSSIIASAATFIMLDVTLQKVTGGGFDPATQVVTSPTVTPYALKGFIDQDMSMYKEGYIIAREATAIALLLQSGAPAEPVEGDVLVVRETSWRITNVYENPAQATWICAVAGAGDEA